MGAARIDIRGSEEREMLESDNGAQTSEPGEKPEVLEREVAEIRENISGIVGELDRRGHELFDWRSQLRKHSALIAAVGASCLVGFALTIAIGVANRRRRSRPLAKVRRLREAVSRMIEHPELVAQPRPSVSRKAVSAAVTAMVGVLAKTLAQRMLDASESEPSLLSPRSSQPSV
jgi:hypothetical protein